MKPGDHAGASPVPTVFPYSTVIAQPVTMVQPTPELPLGDRADLILVVGQSSYGIADLSRATASFILA